MNTRTCPILIDATAVTFCSLKLKILAKLCAELTLQAEQGEMKDALLFVGSSLLETARALNAWEADSQGGRN